MQLFGMEKAEMTIDECVPGIINVLDRALTDTHWGKLLTWERRDIAW